MKRRAVLGGRNRTGVAMVLLTLSIIAVVGGCIDEGSHRSVVSVDGHIASVDPAQGGGGDMGQIGIAYQDDRGEGEIIKPAIVLRQTEIVINGVLSTLADLRAGDSMHGDFRVERNGNGKRYVALTIHVERLP